MLAEADVKVLECCADAVLANTAIRVYKSPAAETSPMTT
jgi:thiazole synthase ThiGH ThiG subunit